MIKMRSMLPLGLLGALAYWIIDSVRQSAMLADTGFVQQLLYPGAEGLSYRIGAGLALLLLAAYAQYLISVSMQHAARLDAQHHENAQRDQQRIHQINDLKAQLDSARADHKQALEEQSQVRAALVKTTREHYAFCANIARELQTSLNAVHAFSRLMHQDALNTLPQEHHGYVLEITQAADRVSELVDDMLDIASIESGRLSVHIDTFAAEPGIEEIVAQIKPLALQKDITLRYGGKPLSDVFIRADESRFKQVFRILLSNAVKFSHIGDEVLIHSSVIHGALLKISISDSGAGLTSVEQSKAFQAFSQFLRDDSIAGAGVNLAVAKQLLDAMGGAIGAEEGAGEGTTFWFCLPLFDPQSRSEGHSAPTAIDSVLQSAQILLVEDNEGNQKILRALIEKAGHHVSIASDGRQALEMAAANTYDLVLMDIRLPDMTGFDVCARLRELEEDGVRIPIIAVSADVMRVTQDDCLKAGMDGFLPKPVGKDDLHSCLQRWLQPAKRLKVRALRKKDPVMAKQEMVNQILGHLSLQITPLTQTMLRLVARAYLQEAEGAFTRLTAASETMNMANIRLNARLLESACADIGAAALAECCRATARLPVACDARTLAPTLDKLSTTYAIVKEIVEDLQEDNVAAVDY